MIDLGRLFKNIVVLKLIELVLGEIRSHSPQFIIRVFFVGHLCEILHHCQFCLFFVLLGNFLFGLIDLYFTGARGRGFLSIYQAKDVVLCRSSLRDGPLGVVFSVYLDWMENVKLVTVSVVQRVILAMAVYILDQLVNQIIFED